MLFLCPMGVRNAQLAPTATAILVDVNNTSVSGLSNKSGNYYYVYATGGNFPYTVQDNEMVTIRVNMDIDSTASTGRFYGVELVMSERVY